MFAEELFQLMNQLVRWLYAPAIAVLLTVTAIAVWDSSLCVGERLSGIKGMRNSASTERIQELGRRRIERSDMLARIGPMLGLMGTLIPLGPGLSALGQGDLDVLARAVITAFDTTVLGLLVGISAFIVGRFRRRWYDDLMEERLNADGSAA